MRRSVIAVVALVTVVATVATTATASETTARATAGVEGPGGAQPQPSLRLFRAWLVAFNSGDQERYRRFVARNFSSAAQWAAPDGGLRDLTGGFRLRKLIRVSVTEASGYMQERDSDQFGYFVLAVSAKTPRKILSLAVVPIARPNEFPIARLTEDQAIAGVEALLRRRSAADQFSGAALVAKGGKVLFSGAYGRADRERGIANTLETRFRIGSMNKMFTAVATLQLVEAGKLALDGPVGRYLPEYPNKEVASKVTIRHLLTHTGGTGDIFGPEFDRNRLQLREHSDYVRLYGSRPPRFEPGTRFEYSNYGFVLLGAIIEAVSGESYYNYVRAHVFGPAGMTGTDSLPESEDVPGRSVGYTRPYEGARSWQPNTDWLPWRGTAAGGGYSTVGDLARFADALTNHELLSAASTQLLVTGKVVLGPGIGYAFGFEDARDNDGSGWVGHGGGAPGMNGDLRIYPKSGYVVAILANLDPPAAQRISDYLDPRLPIS
jgi:D-alanyl-D-alanine carboxypeptidase